METGEGGTQPRRARQQARAAPAPTRLRTASTFVTALPVVGFFLVITTGFQSCS